MIEILTQHLSPSVAEAVQDDYQAITRLLVRGAITGDEAAVARERLTEKVKDMLGNVPAKLKEVA